MRVFISSSDTGQHPTITLLRSFTYTLVENLGLCVHLTDDLRTFMVVLFWVQIVLSAVGILGALTAAAVCVSRKLRSSCCVQLACLAVYDVVFLLSSLLLAALGLAEVWDSAFTKVVLALRNLSLWGATYTLVDICAERCLSIARPFLAHSRFTVGFTLKRSVVMLVLGVAFTVPYVLDLQHGYSVGDGCSQGRSLTWFGLVYTLYISLLLLYVLPFTAVIVVNVVFAVLLCRLHRDRAAVRQSLGGERTAEQQLSVLVLGLSVWYGVSMLAPSLLFLVRLTRVELFAPDWDIRAAALADTLVVLSACTNFIFYFLLWRPFRHVMWERVRETCHCLRLKVGSCRTSSSNVVSDMNSVSGSTTRTRVQESSH